MIDREYARHLAQEDLDLKFEGRFVVSGVEEHELVWIVHYQTPEYLRTRDPMQRLGGNGPYLVDRLDGGLHAIGSSVGDWEDDYRRRIRRMPVRTAVDDLEDAVRQAVTEQGRVVAMRLLRRNVPALTHAEAAEYVTALRSGSAPAHLAAIATETLAPIVPEVVTLRRRQSSCASDPGEPRPHPETPAH
ncbi:YrhB domain-containing protein [Kitasatospora sp. NPDC001664]